MDIKRDCFKCISGINLSLASKSLFTISFNVTVKRKYLTQHLTVFLIPKLLNKPFASCFFTNLDFLIRQTGRFDCIISVIFCSNHFCVNIFSIFFTLHSINLHLIFIASFCKTLNYFLLLCFCFKNLDLCDQ